MRRGWVRAAFLAGTVSLILATSLPDGYAFHFYRGTESGSAVADGARSDDPVGTIPNVTASVALGHNTFGTGLAGTGLSVAALLRPHKIRIKAGESITWTWKSSHCHSVTSNDVVAGATRLFDSGFLYPAAPPESRRAVPGFFEYPILDKTPTLTFPTPGTYRYFCVHHASIGMNGVVIVE